MEEYKQDMQTLLREIADAFYQNKKNVGIQKMPIFIQKLMNISENQMITSNSQKLYLIMSNLLEAYEGKEYVLVADILTYDIAPEIG